jgi:hypothetical protein
MQKKRQERARAREHKPADEGLSRQVIYASASTYIHIICVYTYTYILNARGCAHAKINLTHLKQTKPKLNKTREVIYAEMTRQVTREAKLKTLLMQSNDHAAFTLHLAMCVCACNICIHSPGAHADHQRLAHESDLNP